MVHLWDLYTNSPLLCCFENSEVTGGETGGQNEVKGQLVLLPIGSYLMHHMAVTGVAFCQKYPDIVVTCSKDRYVGT